MKFHNLSIITGTAACNAACPYCISKMTGIKQIGHTQTNINWRNFDKACLIAKDGGVQSVLITGKGEPTLYPDQICEYLEKLQKYNFPLIDLQTNGLRIGQNPKTMKFYLSKWYQLGLSFVAISVVSSMPEKNRLIYTPGAKEYVDLRQSINLIHQTGLSVRLSCTLVKGFTDGILEVKKIIDFCRENNVEQLTLRKVAAAMDSENEAVLEWTKEHELGGKHLKTIGKYLDKNGHRLATIGHGAIIYDVGGQNVCYSDALTLKPEGEDIRQLIFYPDGRISFDWQYQGATIL